jgi:Tfp pilus assembly protein PilX
MSLTNVRARCRPSSEDGFTLLFAIGAMLITSMLVFAAFTETINDQHLSYRDTLQKKAFIAAAAGIQEYEHKLQVNSDYWEKSCEGPKGTVSGESSESYETVVLGANKHTCNFASPFETMIEKEGLNANTFSVKSVGTTGGIHKTLIATFKVSGFLDFAYFTQYEDVDPELTGEGKKCEKYYEEEINGKKERRSEACGNITFDTEDSVNGPMHTDDAALVECNKELTFGRKNQVPKDTVEINGGTWSSSEQEAKGSEATTKKTCTGSSPTYYTTTGKFTKGAELRAPQSDSSVHAYVESGYSFTGRTKIKLTGETLTIQNPNYNGGTAKSGVAWPANGLIFVKTGPEGCNYNYSDSSGGSDTTTTYEDEEECGSVYVEGSYGKSLTIAAETDVIVNGNIVPSGVTVKAGSTPPVPSGTAVMGLMATRFVRIYHPCSGGNNQSSGPAGGYLSNPFIYAANLSTSHSFLVDNYDCGSAMGELSVYGAIAQKFRGIVGTVSNGKVASGYAKEYQYDERLATDEPPYFLAPLDAGWMISRETASHGG